MFFSYSICRKLELNTRLVLVEFQYVLLCQIENYIRCNRECMFCKNCGIDFSINNNCNIKIKQEQKNVITAKAMHCVGIYATIRLFHDTKML